MSNAALKIFSLAKNGNARLNYELDSADEWVI